MAMSIILEQDTDDGHCLLAFCKKLTIAGRISQQLTGAPHSTKAVCHFRHMLEGRGCVVQTDHQPLVHTFIKSADIWSAQQQWHLSAIVEHSCTIKYLKGSANTVVDALLRNCANTIQLRIAYPEIEETQKDDKGLQWLWWIKLTPTWSNPSINSGMMTVTCEMSTRCPCPYLPEGLRRRAFTLAHNLSHPSGRSTIRIIAEQYIWWGMRRDMKTWTRECIPCQTSKVTGHIENGIEEFKTKNHQLPHIHVNIVRTPTHLRRVQISVYHNRQEHQVAGNNTHPKTDGRDLH
ncbi:uncharacterized protein [Macrobrachium rosenbergii]|uniref:uncharacterized protein n=1 Tax=Macrobrachium rosenbergii TaxID=79674 RepID=UPI0034D67990